MSRLEYVWVMIGVLLLIWRVGHLGREVRALKAWRAEVEAERAGSIAARAEATAARSKAWNQMLRNASAIRAEREGRGNG